MRSRRYRDGLGENLLASVSHTSKIQLVGFDPSAPGVTPVPDNGRDKGEFGASEVMVTLPLALPADCGANVAVKVALCEAGTPRAW